MCVFKGLRKWGDHVSSFSIGDVLSRKFKYNHLSFNVKQGSHRMHTQVWGWRGWWRVTLELQLCVMESHWFSNWERRCVLKGLGQVWREWRRVTWGAEPPRKLRGSACRERETRPTAYKSTSDTTQCWIMGGCHKDFWSNLGNWPNSGNARTILGNTPAFLQTSVKLFLFGWSIILPIGMYHRS